VALAGSPSAATRARRWLVAAALGLLFATCARGQPLEIHYINVGQGGSTLIIGPDGTTILYDFGASAGRKRIVPYLRRLPRVSMHRGIDYAIVSHADRDHFAGYADVVAAGYAIRVANFEPGTDKLRGSFKRFALDPSERTPAGRFRPVPLGFPIPLGDGARALVVAANGKVWGRVEPTPVRGARARRLNENDRSIALFVSYGKFQYLIDGDLGSGADPCTGQVTNQQSIQPLVADALIRQGLITEEHGVDVLHIAHHGSESSTAPSYYNLMKPEVGIISVGLNQGSFRHPRKAVVENVLTCRTRDGKFSKTACEDPGSTPRPACVTAPALQGLFQTDNGDPKGCQESDMHCVSFMGIAGGNIVVATDGRTNFTVKVDGATEPQAPRSNMSGPNPPLHAYEFDEDAPRRASGPPR
jgi:beta-lactamase superfamily II metal-dependent hydrolase